jgi:hypothetical protein
MKKFAKVSWCMADISDKRPFWSRKQCEAFLAKIESQLVDDMVQRGWDTIDTLLSMEEDEKEKRAMDKAES